MNLKAKLTLRRRRIRQGRDQLPSHPAMQPLMLPTRPSTSYEHLQISSSQKDTDRHNLKVTEQKSTILIDNGGTSLHQNPEEAAYYPEDLHMPLLFNDQVGLTNTRQEECRQDNDASPPAQ